jgi:hypothetical protein
MSLQLNFAPHSWYKGFAIQHRQNWRAYTLNGMTGYIVTLEADTLKQLRQQINEYTTNEQQRIARLYRGV